MPLQALENLLRIGQLKAESCDTKEVQRMLAMARTRLLDSKLTSLSDEGRFTSAYNAAHAELSDLATKLISDVEKLIKA